MAEADFFDENCENCAYLTPEDSCGNAESVYCGRPVVYRDGDEVVQTAWCECWSPSSEEGMRVP
jgi:hypothetical protein